MIGGTTAGAGNVIIHRLHAQAGSDIAGRAGAIRDTTDAGGSSRIQGNYIGTERTGNASLGSSGIVLLTPNNLVGGVEEGARNVIGPNVPIGGLVTITGAAATGNVVQGNYLSVVPDGTKAISRVFPDYFARGVSIEGGGNNTIGGTTAAARNVISGAGGVSIFGSSGNKIQGNYIGVNAAGTDLLSRDLKYAPGINMFGDIAQNTDNVIGGEAPNARNVVVWGNTGIAASGTRTLVQGNYVGTDASGMRALPNDVGVSIRGVDNVVLDNVISGNEFTGIQLYGGTTARRNLIGVAADGVSPLGNGGVGIDAPISNQMIGGLAPGDGNVIAFNGRAGIFLSVAFRSTDPAVRIRINGNAIHSNGGLGIDIRASDTFEAPITPNDPGDTDAGPNNAQNYPVLNTTTFAGSNVTIAGALNSAPLASYRLEFFASAALNSSGFGEGQHFLGAADVTTDASGNASFEVSFPAPGDARVITATATDALGNTSEFSAGQGQLQNISTRLHVRTGDKVGIAGFIVAGSAPKRVILRALGPSLNVSGVPVASRLEDPVLALVNQAGEVIAFNNNWRDTQRAEIEASGIPPADDREAAIIRTLEPGSYTAIIQGNNESTGVGLVEVYDIGPGSASRLANISTRGSVETGEDVMIGGFIIGPRDTGKAKVVLRALGPSLQNSGVRDALQDPVLELRDASGTLVALSDNWKENQAAIEATGLPPADERESALIGTLGGGNYTAIVSGKNDSMGVGLVEVYNVE